MPLRSCLALLALLPYPAQDAADLEARAQRAGEAFRLLRTEIEKARPREAADPAALGAFVAEVRRRLSSFAAAHAGTEEAIEARLDLAVLAIGTADDPGEGVRLLETLAAEIRSDETRRAQRARVLAFLARALSRAGRLEDARRVWTELRERHADSPLATHAQRALLELQAAERLLPGKEPAPFEATGLDGERLSLASLRGKVVLLDFWATWCPPCRAEIPALRSLYEESRAKGFEIVGVSLDRDDRGAFLAFLERHRIPWPQIHDGRGFDAAVARLYGVRAIPATFLLDRRGVLRHRDSRGEDLRRRVEELLSESP